MSARTLSYRTGIFSLLREILYTLSQAGEEPKAAQFVPTFQKHRDEWQVVLLEEVSIIETLAKAQAGVDRADLRLDRFVRRVMRAVDDHTAGNTRKLLRDKLLKGKAESRFRAPVLGRQLEDMAHWGDTLAKCGVPALAALASEANDHYQMGVAAEVLRAEAQKTNRNFRDVGARKQFIDTLNGSRKEVDGALAKMPFTDAVLPQDFNDGFFLRDAPRDEEEPEETVEDLEASVKAQENQLAETRARLSRKQQEIADAAAAEQAEKDKAAQAEALKKQAEGLLKQAAALMGK
ncbi:MAG: hypothetical protein QM820_02645 [Minicystis sp.]